MAVNTLILLLLLFFAAAGLLVLTAQMLRFRRMLAESDTEQQNHSLIFGLAQLDYFICDEQGVFLIPPHDQNSWALRDGVPLPLEEWLLPEDIPLFRRNFSDLCAGHKRFVKFSYRVRDGKRLRYFTANSILLPRQPGMLVRIFTEIQDITYLREQEKRNADILRELQEKQNLWNVVIDSVPILFSVKDMDENGKYMICNRAFATFLNRKPDEIIGKTDSELFDEETAQTIHKSDLLALDCPEGRDSEDRVLRASGISHWFNTHRRMYQSVEKHRHMICASGDITAMRHLLNCEQTYNEALIQSALKSEPRDVQNMLADILIRNIQADRVILAKYDGHRLTMAEEWLAEGIASARPHLEIIENQWNEYLKQAPDLQPMLLSNLHDSPFADSFANLSGYTTQSVVFAPIYVKECFWGALFVDYERCRRELCDTDEKLAVSMANILSICEVRKQLSEDVRRSEYEKSIILDNARIPLWLFDGQGELIRANDETGKLVNVKSSALTTAINRRITASHLEKGAVTPVVKVMESRCPEKNELRMGNRTFTINAIPVFSEGRDLSYIVQYAIETTALRSWLENQRVINFCLENILGEENTDQAFANVIHSVCDYLQADCAFTFRFPTDNLPHPDCQKYCASPQQWDVELFCANLAKNIKWCKELADRHILSISTLDVPDSVILPDAQRALLTSAGVKSIYFVDISVKDELAGCLGVTYRNTARQLSEYETNFISSVRYIFEQLILRDQTRKKLIQTLNDVQKAEQEKTRRLINEQLLNRGMNAVLREENPIQAMNVVLQMLCESLSISRVCIMRLNSETGECIPAYEQLRTADEEKLLGSQPIVLGNCLAEKILAGEKVFFNNVSECDHISCGIFSALTEKNIAVKSFGLVGLRANNLLWGCMGFTYEDQPHSISSDEKDFLQAFIHLIELMIQRTLVHEQLLVALEQAQAAAKAKSFFLASISHEIRTPLNAVIGFAGLLKSPELDEKTRTEYLNSIVYSGNALLQLINDVLDLSSLEANKMKLVPEVTDFTELGLAIINVFAFQADTNGVELHHSFSKIPLLLLDKLRIRQIIFNLLGNAVKFTSHGQVSLTAEYRPTSDGRGTLYFSVKDSGIGISLEDQKKLMEPFVQLSKLRGTNSGNNGTGLGLAISRRLVEIMGGILTMTSKVGSGSIFSVELPVVCVSSNAACLLNHADALPDETAELKSFERLSLLLVDDVSMNLKVLTAICRKAGIVNIREASSGPEALKLLADEHFDLVFSDLWMPEMNGVELADRIRNCERTQNIPIYIVTADIESHANFNMEKFTGILMKPVSIDKIKDIIRRWAK